MNRNAANDVAARFAQALTAARHHKGWTRTQLARRAGLTTQTIRRLETCERITRLETAYKLATALGLSLTDMV